LPPEPAAIVQGDRSVLVDVDHPGYETARKVLAVFAEIEKSPEHVHTYRVSDLSLWNAAASGVKPEAVVEGLRSISRYPIPEHLEQEVIERMRSRSALARVLVGLRIDGDDLPNTPCTIVSDGATVGSMTSVCHSLSTGSVLALGYVRQKSSELGTAVELSMESGTAQAKVVELPIGA